MRWGEAERIGCRVSRLYVGLLESRVKPSGVEDGVFDTE